MTSSGVAARFGLRDPRRSLALLIVLGLAAGGVLGCSNDEDNASACTVDMRDEHLEVRATDPPSVWRVADDREEEVGSGSTFAIPFLEGEDAVVVVVDRQSDRTYSVTGSSGSVDAGPLDGCDLNGTEVLVARGVLGEDLTLDVAEGDEPVLEDAPLVSGQVVALVGS